MIASARLLLGTTAVLACFAANQLLARAALGPLGTDPLTFTAVRLLAGAAALLALGARGRGAGGGGWLPALLLAAYAVAFSLAYVRVGTGAGALVQFAAVQGTMFGWLLARGGRPRPRQVIGLVVAFAGLAALARPGGGAPDLAGTVLMAVAGVAWGGYSAAAGAPRDALSATAGNFARCAPLALALLLVHRPPAGAAGATGLALAALSGAVASGVGYAAWYAVVPGLGVARAAVVQLAVPVVAAAGGALWLDEPLSLRLVASGAAILAGIGVSVTGR